MIGVPHRIPSVNEKHCRAITDSITGRFVHFRKGVSGILHNAVHIGVEKSLLPRPGTDEPSRRIVELHRHSAGIMRRTPLPGIKREYFYSSSVSTGGIWLRLVTSRGR
jgi:hypothetical protein